MKFLRVGDEIIRLDMITRIKEGRRDETYYGRSVRKSLEGGWLEIHFVAGEMLKIEGAAASALRRFLEIECQVQDLAVFI